MVVVEIIEQNEDLDGDDLARELQKTRKEKQELREYEEWLVERLAQLAIDQEGKILITAYGSFKARWASANRKWNRDSLAQEVFILARRGELHEPDRDGELPGDADWRVFDAIKKVFRLEPRIGEVKAIDLDPDEFSEVDGQGHWSVQVLSQ